MMPHRALGAIPYDETMRPGSELLAEGAAAAPRTLPVSAFCQRHGVTSETAFKQRARDRREITYHAHVGLADWPATRAMIEEVRDGLRARGSDLDRYGLCLSRAMGIAPHLRASVAKETGPLIADDEWQELATLAVQPHLGDAMIGTPYGFENARAALAGGAATIGNLGQHFAFTWPGTGDVELTEQTVRALGLMAAMREQGALVHSYLDDGVAMQVATYGAYVGWAALEHHLVVDLCGARLGHCYGGLIDVPLHRAVVHVALADLHGPDVVGTMVYGNTVDLGFDHERNRAVVTASTLVDIAAQLHRPTGHAIHVTPLTEAQRIPNAAEVLEVQVLARELEREARRTSTLFHWAEIDRLAAACLAHGLRFRDASLAFLAADGVDVSDPAALLLALRRLGAAGLERRVALPPDDDVAGLVPWKHRLLGSLVERAGAGLGNLAGHRVGLAVLDVHDVVRDALARALPAAGAEVVLLPSDATVTAVARTAVDEDLDAIVVGTYNGSALTLARQLLAALADERWEGRVVMGGVLNEDEGGPLPVDVTDRVRALGIRTVSAIEELGAVLA